MPGSTRQLEHIQVVLFDFDGTLADTIPLILASYRHATATVLGEALPDTVLLSDLGRPLIEQMTELAPDRAHDVWVAYREHNLAHHDSMIREYPGVLDAVKAVKARGYRLGVVTSKMADLAWMGLRALGAEDLFEAVVTVEDTERHKPEAEPILAALERMGTDAECAAYVGDSPHDIAAGKAAGTSTVGVSWGPFAEEALRASGPDRVVSTPFDLLKVFPGADPPVGVQLGAAQGGASGHLERSSAP